MEKFRYGNEIIARASDVLQGLMITINRRQLRRKAYQKLESEIGMN